MSILAGYLDVVINQFESQPKMGNPDIFSAEFLYLSRDTATVQKYVKITSLNIRVISGN
jgi:hypothetical protein